MNTIKSTIHRPLNQIMKQTNPHATSHICMPVLFLAISTGDQRHGLRQLSEKSYFTVVGKSLYYNTSYSDQVF